MPLPRLRHLGMTLRALLTHEAANERQLHPLLRFAGWQLMKRAGSGPITIDAFDGGRLRCYPNSTASNAVIYFGLPDWDEMQFLRAILRPGDGFLDVGANVGVYSIYAHTLVGAEGRVLAFEPDPTNAIRLRENFELNGLSAEDVHEVALAEAAGTCRFDVGQDSTGGVVPEDRRDGVEVRCARLDAIVDDPSAFTVAKVDVEGFELEVLKGATTLLEADAPKAWLLETNRCCEKYGMTRTELQECMIEHGFALYRLTEAGRCLESIAHGGPFPANSLALSDLDWLHERAPYITVR